MSEIPQLKLHLVENDQGMTGCRLDGWDELNQWARNNLIIWRDVTKVGERYQMSETDQLKILVWSYLSELERLREDYTKHLREVEFDIHP